MALTTGATVALLVLLAAPPASHGSNLVVLVADNEARAGLIVGARDAVEA